MKLDNLINSFNEINNTIKSEVEILKEKVLSHCKLEELIAMKDSKVRSILDKIGINTHRVLIEVKHLFKYELNTATQQLELDRVSNFAMNNVVYGCLKENTLALDGDPLDAYVVLPAVLNLSGLSNNTVLNTIVLTMISSIDNGEEDNKIITFPTSMLFYLFTVQGTGYFIPLIEIISLMFIQNSFGKKVTVDNISTREEAEHHIQECIDRFKKVNI